MEEGLDEEDEVELDEEDEEDEVELDEEEGLDEEDEEGLDEEDEDEVPMWFSDDGEEDDDVSTKRRKKSEDRVHDHEEGSHEQASAVPSAPVPAPPDVRVRTRTAVANVTVCDADAMKCGVCFLALRPPIFQCELGHVVCSSCRDKLEATGNGVCHVCGVATHGYRRCHAMEHLVDSIRVPCPWLPYGAYACDATPPYHGQESHRLVCPHAPCHCPGESCGFIGSVTALLAHFASTHNWPCTTKVRDGEAFSIRLHDGFNFLLANHASDDGDQQAANCGVPCRLFLFNVSQERIGRAISVLCIHPHASAGATTNSTQLLLSMQCEMASMNFLLSHHQRSVFKVVCTDLSSGLPNPESCFQFFVHNAVLGDGDDKNSIEIEARFIN